MVTIHSGVVSVKQALLAASASVPGVWAAAAFAAENDAATDALRREPDRSATELRRRIAEAGADGLGEVRGQRDGVGLRGLEHAVEREVAAHGVVVTPTVEDGVDAAGALPGCAGHERGA